MPCLTNDLLSVLFGALLFDSLAAAGYHGNAPTKNCNGSAKKRCMMRSGKISRMAGIVMFLTGFGIIQFYNQGYDHVTHAGETQKLWIALFAVFAFVVGAFFVWRGRQYANRATASSTLNDGKPDVLYLRSFRDDRRWFDCFPLNSISDVFVTEEEQLAEVLRPFGDLVAIGRPGEALPTPGAARMYAADNEWREVVTHQMQAARLVVIRAGLSDNLLWELQQAIATVSPQKLLILVLKMKNKDYEGFREKIKLILGELLPEGKTLLSQMRSIELSGFIGFTDAWKPKFYGLPLTFLRSSLFKPYKNRFKMALRPVFEAAGLVWRAPPISFMAISGIMMLAGCVVVILGAIVIQL